LDEHDDDLESEVQEDANVEADAFPDTGDELDDPLQDDDESVPTDPDQAEL